MSSNLTLLVNVLILILFSIFNSSDGTSFAGHSSSEHAVSCKCASRPIKYVAIEIPKIIKVTAPALLPPSSHFQQIEPITWPFINRLAFPASPQPSPPSHLYSSSPSSVGNL